MSDKELYTLLSRIEIMLALTLTLSAANIALIFFFEFVILKATNH